MFGGLKGLEYSLEADESLNIEEPSLLFDHYVNTCPNQGSRTIRTEVCICLMVRSIKSHVISHNLGNTNLCHSKNSDF